MGGGIHRLLSPSYFVISCRFFFVAPFCLVRWHVDPEACGPPSGIPCRPPPGLGPYLAAATLLPPSETGHGPAGSSQVSPFQEWGQPSTPPPARPTPAAAASASAFIPTGAALAVGRAVPLDPRRPPSPHQPVGRSPPPRHRGCPIPTGRSAAAPLLSSGRFLEDGAVHNGEDRYRATPRFTFVLGTGGVLPPFLSAIGVNPPNPQNHPPPPNFVPTQAAPNLGCPAPKQTPPPPPNASTPPGSRTSALPFPPSPERVGAKATRDVPVGTWHRPRPGPGIPAHPEDRPPTPPFIDSDGGVPPIYPFTPPSHGAPESGAGPWYHRPVAASIVPPEGSPRPESPPPGIAVLFVPFPRRGASLPGSRECPVGGGGGVAPHPTPFPPFHLSPVRY